jgi:hypothetical protein
MPYEIWKESYKNEKKNKKMVLYLGTEVVFTSFRFGLYFFF